MTAVAVLHVAAIALYYALGIAHAPEGRQRMFGWVWIGCTAALVFGGLQRIKRARRMR
ncbi:MAG TPA: hypothetical protein VF483_05025 [Gemmatimonadaceae bacterium]